MRINAFHAHQREPQSKAAHTIHRNRREYYQSDNGKNCIRNRRRKAIPHISEKAVNYESNGVYRYAHSGIEYGGQSVVVKRTADLSDAEIAYAEMPYNCAHNASRRYNRADYA